MQAVEAPFGWYGSRGIWMVWRNSGGICERKTLFPDEKKKRIKPGLRARERGPDPLESGNYSH